MPQATVNLLETISTLLPSSANIFAIAGACSAGNTSNYYDYAPETPPGTVRTDLGDGPLTEAIVTQLRYGKRRVVGFPVATTTNGSLSAVTATRPSNPLAIVSLTCTVAGKAAVSGTSTIGPWDSLSCCVRVKDGGANGTFEYTLDHQVKNGAYLGTYTGPITIPAAQKAVIVGTIDISTISSLSATLDTLTFIITSDTGTSTTTFSTPANIAAVLSQLNAGHSGEATFAYVGSNKIAMYSVTTGATGTLSVGAGTANAVLGFTEAAADTGAAATYEIPNTGIVVTFGTGTYTAGDVYTFTSTGPRFAAAALSGLFTRIHAVISSGIPIGAVWPVQEDADVLDGRTMLDALSTQLTASRVAKFYLWALYQLSRSAADADVVTYVGTFTDPYVMCSVGAFKAYGGLLTGSRFDRPASWVAAWKAARDRFSSDLGSHADRALNTAFGVTEIVRDERTASTKLATFRTAQNANGGGFLALETPSNAVGEAHFYRGRTLAPVGSILGDGGSMRLILQMGRQAQRSLDLEMNTDPPLRSDGTLVDDVAIAARILEPLNELVFRDPEAPAGHASSVSVGDPSYSGGTLRIAVSAGRNAQIKAIVSNVGVIEVVETATAEV